MHSSFIFQAEEQIKVSEQQVRFINKNLEKEVARFDREKQHEIRELLHVHALNQVECARERRAMWEALRDSVDKI